MMTMNNRSFVNPNSMLFPVYMRCFFLVLVFVIGAWCICVVFLPRVSLFSSLRLRPSRMSNRLVLGGSSLLGLGLSSIAVVLLNVASLPRVADPLVTDGESGEVAALGDDVLGKSTLLGLVLVLLVAHALENVICGTFWCIARSNEPTYVEDEDGELGLLAFAEGLTGSLDILLELLDGVLESGAGVIDLIDDEDTLADKVLHGTKGSEVEPLGAGNLGTGLLNDIVTERLVERETDGLDGDVGRAGALEERACLLYTSPSPRDQRGSRMPSSA